MDCDNDTSTTEISILLIGNEEWLEKPSLWDFRLWHVILIFFSGFLSLVICVCCCVRFRIPRTKQEIEADYIRKKIMRKFKKQLRMIKNSEMDEMDLKKALDRIRTEFKSDTESIAHSEAFSDGSSDGQIITPTRHSSLRRTSVIGVDIEQLIEERNSGIGSKFSKMVGSFKLLRSRKSNESVTSGEHVP